MELRRVEKEAKTGVAKQARKKERDGEPAPKRRKKEKDLEAESRTGSTTGKRKRKEADNSKFLPSAAAAPPVTMTKQEKEALQGKFDSLNDDQLDEVLDFLGLKGDDDDIELDIDKLTATKQQELKIFVDDLMHGQAEKAQKPPTPEFPLATPLRPEASPLAAETSAEAPAETAAEAPAETSAEAPAETAAEAPAEAPAEAAVGAAETAAAERALPEATEAVAAATASEEPETLPVGAGESMLDSTDEVLSMMDM